MNRYFAETLVSELDEGDSVWIHDYQLMLLPYFLRQMLNERQKDVRIRFFLHTVFPASDFFRILLVGKDILAGMLHSDVIGFRNPDYTEISSRTAKKICT